MKKRILGIVVALTLSTMSFAKWQIDFAGADFFDSDGSLVQEAYNFAFIVDVNNVGFYDFKLYEGDKIAKGEFLNSSNSFKTLITGQLEDDGGYMTAFSKSTWIFDNNEYGFAGGEEVAIIVWTGGETIALKDEFMIFTPSMDNGNKSGGMAWTVPESNNNPWTWRLLSKSTGMGTVDDTYTMLNGKVTVIPEPSTYAAVFSIIALMLSVLRRKKMIFSKIG